MPRHCEEAEPTKKIQGDVLVLDCFAPLANDG
jgi:hypothetical protein